MRSRAPLALLGLAAVQAGCGQKVDPVQSLSDPPPPAQAAAPCWERDIRPILANRCFACHGEGRPFDLSTLELARLSLEPLRTKIRSEQMPPDPPPLDSIRRTLLLEWALGQGPACGP